MIKSWRGKTESKKKEVGITEKKIKENLKKKKEEKKSINNLKINKTEM